ncbi:MAG: hypothetical protein CMH57_11890, partial [Myxococcales bacterium]|nr:hypothetical protein [Myxococcales bacterium]
MHSGEPTRGWWSRAPSVGLLGWVTPSGDVVPMGPEAARRASGVLATDLEGPRGERLRTVEHWLAA